jgi:hypothetical protein
VHPQCTSIQRPQYSITPSWHETSKTFNLKSNALLQMHNYSIHLQHKWNTHRHSYKTEHMQEKLLLFILKMANACNYNGVPELSLALLFSTTLIYNPPLQNEISRSLLPKGLIKRFPPSLPTLFNYNEWLSSPASGSRYQPYNTLMVDLPNACTKAQLPWLTSLSI